MPGQIAIIGGTVRTLKRNFYFSLSLFPSLANYFPSMSVLGARRCPGKTEWKIFNAAQSVSPSISTNRTGSDADGQITWLIADTKFYPRAAKSSLIVYFASSWTIIYEHREASACKNLPRNWLEMETLGKLLRVESTLNEERHSRAATRHFKANEAYNGNGGARRMRRAKR